MVKLTQIKNNNIFQNNRSQRWSLSRVAVLQNLRFHDEHEQKQSIQVNQIDQSDILLRNIQRTLRREWPGFKHHVGQFVQPAADHRIQNPERGTDPSLSHPVSLRPRCKPWVPHDGIPQRTLQEYGWQINLRSWNS